MPASRLLAFLLTSTFISAPGMYASQVNAAQTSADDSTASSVELAPTLVTANRVLQRADAALASVTILTRDDLDRLQAHSLEDALAGLPGVSFVNNGGAGKLTSLLLRGTESDHVLVLLDGVRISSATSGLAALQDLPMDLIDRIELVRGPRASLYGSEAIGGVLQIFTRAPVSATPRTQFQASLGAGSERTRRGSLSLQQASADYWLSLNAAHDETAGFDSCRGVPSLAGCFTTEPDRDGYRQDAVQLRGGMTISPGLKLDAHLYDVQAHSDFDGDFVNQTATEQRVLGATLLAAPHPDWALRLDAARAQDLSDNLKDGQFQNRFNTARNSLTLQNDWRWRPGQRLSAGLDTTHETIDSDTLYDRQQRNNTGLYVQYQGQLGARNTLQVSGRHDDNEQFGEHDTGAIAWGLDLGHQLQLTASYGSAFKAPSFNDLYYPGFGNAALQPERSRSTELGLAQTLRLDQSTLHWGLNAYVTRIRDLIGFDPVAFIPNNIDRARIQGLEAVTDWRAGPWRLAASVTHLDPRDQNTGNQLARRPRNSARIDIDHQQNQWQWGMSLNAAGQRYDDQDNKVKLGGYGVVDLRAAYTLAKDWHLQAKLNNVLDKTYETAAYYRQAPRGVFVNLQYQPK